MRLHGPHVGVELVGVQTVAVGLALRGKHEVVQFLDAEFALGPLFEDAGLQKEARVDVHHDLRGVLQERVQHGQPVGTGGPIKGGGRHESLAEDACRFGQWHGCRTLGGGTVGQVDVVIRVAKFVGKGLDAVETVGEVHEDTGLVTPDAHAEGAVPFAVPWFGVNPSFTHCPAGDSGEAVGIVREAIDDEGLGLRIGPRTGTLTQWGEEVEPRQWSGVSEEAGLGAEVASEVRE